MGKSDRVEDRKPFTQRVVKQAINVRLRTQTPLLYTVDIRLQKFKVNHILNSTTDLQIVGNRKTELQIFVHPKNIINPAVVTWGLCDPSPF